ncbi:DUF4862 family protein [Agromyces silvae]|uniref:DUF4862 family protein n=1 Tax=Agromyces silvae TaxID=3388266 RepID=UPI00280A6E07|nr:DUF4862 family protein [Agromyces protaetiae]
MTPRTPAVVVGAYAALPSEASAQDRFIRGVLDLPGVDGFELPLMIDAATDRRWLDWTPPGRPSVATLIPAFAIRSRQDPRFGLASADPEGRAAALDLLRRLHDTARQWHDLGRELSVVSMSSAPQMTDPAAAERAFECSLREIRGWDWGSTRLVVEHCDAPRPEHAPEKGYLALEREVRAIERTDDGRTECGIAVNWGRSVLEHRDVAGAARDAARAGDRLRGFILSGVSDRDTEYGPAWADAHTPVVHEASDDSLLTLSRARDVLARLPRELWYLAVKTGAKPASLSATQRIALIAPAVQLLTATRDLAEAAK